MTKTHVKKLRFLHKKSTQKKHTKKAHKKATGSDCDSRFLVASIIFSDVLESR